MDDMQAGDRAGWRPGPGLLEAAWRYKWLIVVCTLLSGLAAFGASLFTLVDTPPLLAVADTAPVAASATT